MAAKKPTSKKPVIPDTPSRAKRTRPFSPKEKNTVEAIKRSAALTHERIVKRGKPEMHFPVRSLSNVIYDEKVGYFQLGGQSKVRALTVNTCKTFAQSLKLMALSKELVETDDFATKRDAYYQSKNWGDARFTEQPESDAVMDDIEAMFSTDSVSREDLRFIPDQHGGDVAGPLLIVDPGRGADERVEVDCTRFGSGAYSIPSFVEQLEYETRAKFILAVETRGMFERLQRQRYWEAANCILVSLGGVPTRACRRFLRLLSERAKIPVYAFTDCDPYGIGNIYRTLKVGSGNAAHINQFFCVPEASYLGLAPQDIIDYELDKNDAVHPLGEVDLKRARDALKNDPFFQFYKPWKEAIQLLIDMKVRAEQQAFSKFGLNFVIDHYLPNKLRDPGKFLP
jgi:DNA topoisomerase-6 subunit A